MTQDVAAARVDLERLSKLADAIQTASFHNAAESAGYGFASVEGERLLSSDIRSLLARVAALEEGLVQADLAIRAYPGATQEDVAFIRALLDSQKGSGS